MDSKNTNGILPDETLASFILKKSQKERLDHIAWYERRNKKDVRQEAIDYYLELKKDIPEKE